MSKVKTKCSCNGEEFECEVEYSWKTSSTTNEVEKHDIELPKNKTGINISMTVNAEDAEVIRESLKKAGHCRLAEEFETRRELGIMHDFWDCQKNGENIFEKWAKGNYGECSIKAPRYKMKHRVFVK